MAGFVRTTKNPNSSLTHHGLIKLIILRSLAQRNQTWEQFIGQIQINQEPALFRGVPIEAKVEVPVLLGAVQNQEEHANVQLGGDEKQQEDLSPSNLVGGEMRLDWMVSQMTKQKNWRKMQEKTLWRD